MAGTNKGVRLSKAAREVNLGVDSVVAHLKKKGFNVQASPNTKITSEMYQLLLRDFQINIALKEKADGISFRNKKEEIAVKKNALTPAILKDTAEKANAKVTEKNTKAVKKPTVKIETEQKQPLKEKALPISKPKITPPSVETPKKEEAITKPTIEKVEPKPIPKLEKTVAMVHTQLAEALNF